MKTYVFKKGKHNLSSGEPLQLWQPGKVGILQWTVQFDETCQYILPRSEQEDWLKGGGIAMDLFSNNRNAIMWGWRYTPDINRIEVCLYAHPGKERYFSEPLMALEIGATVTARIYKQSAWVWIVEFFSGEQRAQASVSIRASPFLCRRIPAWFGGTLPAPWDVNWHMEFEML
jgi:hypothetical protein